jgi:hypothetical protein
MPGRVIERHHDKQASQWDHSPSVPFGAAQWMKEGDLWPSKLSSYCILDCIFHEVANQIVISFEVNGCLIIYSL